MKAALVFYSFLVWATAAEAKNCEEECVRTRNLRKRQLEGCLKEANKAPPRARPKARIECRRRAVIPKCDGLPPCPEGQGAAGGIEVLTHYFANAEDGKPMSRAVFAPGETVFLRYQGVVAPDPNSDDIRLRGDVVLRQGKKELQRRKRDVKMTKRLPEEGREQFYKFGGRASFALAKDLEPGEYAIELQLQEETTKARLTRGYRFLVGKPPAK